MQGRDREKTRKKIKGGEKGEARSGEGMRCRKSRREREREWDQGGYGVSE